LKIDINAPVIKIPLNSLSHDGIIVDLGSLNIRNKLEHQEKETSNKTGYNVVLTDNINVTLKSFKVIRFVIKAGLLTEREVCTVKYQIEVF
jgi:hypothetical protein